MTTRNATVNLRGDVSNYTRSIAQARTATAAFVRSLDSSNDRMSMLVQTGLALGPALAPIGAAAVPALSGLTNQLAFAGVGAGVAVLAFAGVGDALKDLNAYALEPTDSNFLKMQEAMEALGPAGREFAVYLQSLRPELQRLQDVAQEGLFPGLMLGMDELMDLMPQVEGIISEVSSTTGRLMAEAGDNLNDPRWREFFNFLEAEARPTLLDMGRTIGNFAEGFAQLWMAFDPISDQFSESFLNLSRDFKEWASSLDETEGFQDFVDYLARITPKVWDTLGSIAEALLAISVAAAPVGEAALPVIELMAETLTLIADSPAGPVLIAAAAGISAVARAVALYNVAQGSQMVQLLSGTALGGAARAARDLPRASSAFLDFGVALDAAGSRANGFRNTTERLGSALSGTGRLVAGGTGAALAMSDLGNSFALANTASYALIGTMFGPWGTAIGAGVGAVKDLQAANEGLAAAVEYANRAIESGSLEEITAAMAELRSQLDRSGGFGQSIIDFADGLHWLAGGPAILDSLTSSTSEADEALKGLGDAQWEARLAAQEQKFEEAGLSEAMAGASQSAKDQAEALLDSVAAKNANRDAALQGRAAERDLEAAIDAATEAVRENGATLDITTEAGRDNQEALDAIAGTWNKLTSEAQRAPGRYEEARAAFVETAIQMGHNEAQAEALANQLLDIPVKVSTDITTPGAPAAIRNAIDIAARLGAIPPAVSTFLRAVDHASGVIRPVQDALYRLSTGVTIPVRVSMPGQIPTLNDVFAMKRADGGLVLGPGGPRDDKVPAMLSNGEFVVNAAATARHIGLLHQINAKKFADGGLVSGNSTPPRSFQPAAPLGSMPAMSGTSAAARSQVVNNFEAISVTTANPLEAVSELGGEIAWRLRG